jgi:hypothetical protein
MAWLQPRWPWLHGCVQNSVEGAAATPIRPCRATVPGQVVPDLTVPLIPRTLLPNTRVCVMASWHLIGRCVRALCLRRSDAFQTSLVPGAACHPVGPGCLQPCGHTPADGHRHAPTGHCDFSAAHSHCSPRRGACGLDRGWCTVPWGSECPGDVAGVLGIPLTILCPSHTGDGSASG